MSVAKSITPDRLGALFAGIKDTKMRQGGNYIREGRFLLRMDDLKMDERRTGTAFVAVEMTVLKVLDESRNHKVGEAVCHWMDCTKESFKGNIKSMIANILDMKPEEIDVEQCITLFMADSPFSGMVVEVFAKDILTKKGKPFTQVDYKREVPPTEALLLLSEEIQNLYFPKNLLQRMAQAQSQLTQKSA